MSPKPFRWRIFGWNNLRSYFSGSMVERERAALYELYASVAAAHRRSPYADHDVALGFTAEIVSEACRRADVVVCDSLDEALLETVWQFLEADPIIFGMPDAASLDHLSIDGAVELRSFLHAKARFLANRARYEDIWREKIIRTIEGFLGYLPSAAFDTGAVRGTTFSVPLIDLCSNPAEAIERALVTMYDDDIVDAGLYEPIRKRIEVNLAASMGMTLERAAQTGRAPVLPTAADQAPRELVATYLAGTPFERLFSADLPFPIPQPARFEHMHILAGTGHGKTQTLQHLMLSDLETPDPPSLVIIDSQGDLIAKLSRLARFEGSDRLIIIDPKDVDHPPALNMFDVQLERLNRYGRADREQILNGIIELYEYFFGSLLGAELTQKQSLIFRYIARLMINIPSANLRTLIELMDDVRPYARVIATLPESSRLFFEKEFSDRSFNETKTQVKRRLYGIVENQTFERMFSAPRNRVDIPAALNEGKIVLVNTAKDFLKGGSSILGRYFIALTLQAALERAAIPEEQRRPAFLYIDEASEYFDNNIDNILIQARKYKLGLLLAHQYLDQLQGGLRASIASNTSVKFAGGVSDRDARSVAPDMRTSPSFILEQRKGKADTRFACYIRNVTGQALSLSVPFGTMEREPVMSEEAYERLREDNRRRVSGGPPAGPKTPTSPPSNPAPPESDPDPGVRLLQPDLPTKLEKTDPDAGDHTKATDKW